MTLYVMLRLLHGYVHEDPFYINLLSENVLFFVPIVNLDGVEYMSNAFDMEDEFPLIRKNRHIYWNMVNCRTYL